MTKTKFDLKMKCLIAFSFALIALVAVNGSKTYRANRQLMFAQRVQMKIGIDTIKVRPVKDALVLEGIGSEPQIRYAEKVATAFVQKYSSQISNPPKTVRNQIVDKRVAMRNRGGREVASVKSR